MLRDRDIHVLIRDSLLCTINADSVNLAAVLVNVFLSGERTTLCSITIISKFTYRCWYCDIDGLVRHRKSRAILLNDLDYVRLSTF